MTAPESAWRRHLEAQVLELEADTPEGSAYFIQSLRESRAAWMLLLPAPGQNAQALFIGDAQSGTPAGLARLGYQVHIHDSQSAAFAEARGRATGAPMSQAAAPQTFDLVLIEDDLKAASISLDEAAALSHNLVAFTADNPLAYKRSSGTRADFRTSSPVAFLKALLFEKGTRLGAQRAKLQRLTNQSAKAASLYPDRRDFAHVVDLQTLAPDLTIGPMERTNRPKLIGRRIGLFKHLTPSYGIWSSKQSAQPMRLIDQLLAALQHQVNAPQVHQPQHLVATRGNSALVQTDAGWVMRVPLGHRPTDALQKNAAGLQHMAAHFPCFPVPSPLFAGPIQVAGGAPILVSIETRLAGLGAGQLAQNTSAFGRLIAQVATKLASLQTGPKTQLSEDDAQASFAKQFATVSERAAHPATLSALAELQKRVAKLATGQTIPRVACHHDLRPKHVISAPNGDLIGIVDWSSFKPSGPPLYDLFHLIAQHRTTQPGQTPKLVWHTLQTRENLAPHERQAIEAYEAALDLPRDWYAVIALAYPVLFGAMAEENWDFSRPMWIRRMFGIGL